MAQAKVRKGWESKTIWGKVNGRSVRGVKLSELSAEDLQSLLDQDPKKASKFIDGTPSEKAEKTDNKPNAPLPEKPK